jgi:glycolate oxidase
MNRVILSEKRGQEWQIVTSGRPGAVFRGRKTDLCGACWRNAPRRIFRRDFVLAAIPPKEPFFHHPSNTLTMIDTPAGFRAFLEALGEVPVLTAEEDLTRFANDETEDLRFLPQVVALPRNTEEVAAVMRACSHWGVPVTPRGAGSGLAGGALPVHGGLVLCTERMNRLLWLDERNLQVCVEPGMVTETLQHAVREKGLFYPPDPASRGWSFIGGNVSTNAGGPKAVKYGVVRDYVLNLEVVLASGETIWTGANVLKNSTGLNLTQLFVGSEGTLGIITKIVLKLLPHPTQRLLLLAPFRSPENACAAVSAIFRAGVTPSGLEFMERAALERARDYLGDLSLPLPDDVAAHLLIEVDGFHPETLHADCARIAEVLEAHDCGEVLFADSEAQQQDLWRMRRCVGHAVKHGSVYKEEDTVVPRAELPVLLRGVKEIGARWGFESVCYGHAGDGNLHVNILRGGLDDRAWREDVPAGIREIFALVKSLGGMLSGEHGVGYVQRPYVDIFYSETERALRRGLKQVFDPQGLLNPGKGV